MVSLAQKIWLPMLSEFRSEFFLHWFFIFHWFNFFATVTFVSSHDIFGDRFRKSGFTIMAVKNPPERKLAKRTFVQCINRGIPELIMSILASFFAQPIFSAINSWWQILFLQPKMTFSSWFLCGCFAYYVHIVTLTACRTLQSLVLWLCKLISQFQCM